MWPRSQCTSGLFARSGFSSANHHILMPVNEQEGAEHVEQPVELRDQPGAGEDHHRAHDDRAEHAVDQHALLQLEPARAKNENSISQTKTLSTASDFSIR